MRESKKKLPKRFLAKVRRDREAILATEKDRLIRIGKRMRQRHDLLRDTMQSLRAERLAQKMSLGTLADRTGISKAALSRLENFPAPNPTVATLQRIADALGKRILIRLAPAA